MIERHEGPLRQLARQREHPRQLLQPRRALGTGWLPKEIYSDMYPERDIRNLTIVVKGRTDMNIRTFRRTNMWDGCFDSVESSELIINKLVNQRSHEVFLNVPYRSQ